MIQVENVFFEYDDFRALENVSCHLEPSSIIGLVGPNGAGKTTLMRCMATFQHPFSGRITIDSFDTMHQTRKCHSMVKFLPDFSCFYESLTVTQFLEFSAGASKQFDLNSSIVSDSLSLLDLTPYQDNLLSTLSRGWRQRAGIASMVVSGAKYLLLDEPASGLDPEARVHLAEVFKELKARGHGLLISSHILEELDQYCDDVIVMKNGSVRTGLNKADTKQTATFVEVKTNKPEEFSKFLNENRDTLGIEDFKVRGQNIKDLYMDNLREKN